MRPAEKAQRLVIQRLKAQRDAVDARGRERREIGGFDAGGVGLKRDLKIGRCAPVPGCGLDQRPGDRGRHQRWRAAAEEDRGKPAARSEEHTSELQSLMRISYAV